MDLFSNETNEQRNLLPYDGTVIYYGRLIPLKTANHYMNELLNNIEWKNDEAVIFGKHILTKRKVAWYGDKEFEYTYSNTTKKALPWTAALLELKKIAEKTLGETFNSLPYRRRGDGMAQRW
jgi:alkylated DNA repair dioxygenase AlkB